MINWLLDLEIGIGSVRLSPRKLTSHALFSGSIVMIGGSLAINVVNYIYHLLMGRMMGPEGYGELGSIFSILYIISIVPVSTSFAIVKFISSAKNKKEQMQIYYAIRSFVFKLSIVLSLLLVAVSYPISSFLHLTNPVTIVLIGPILFFMLMTLVNKATLQGELNFWGVVGPDAVTNGLKLLFGLILVYIGYSVLGAVIAILIGIIFAYLLSSHMMRKYTDSFSGNYDIKPILRYSFPVLIQSLAFTSLFSVDLLMVKHFLSPEDAGLYAALSTLGKIIYFAAQPVTGVMFPLVSGRRAKGLPYKSVFYLSAGITVGISFVAVVAFRLLPDLAIGTLYGAEYVSAANNLFLMGVFMMLYTVANFLVNYLLSLHDTKIVILPILISLIQVIVLWNIHTSIREVLMVNLGLTSVLIVGIIAYIGYTKVRYGK